MLYAGLQNLSLYNDTDMPGDLITSDPTVTGTVSGDFMYGADVEFDHNGDGMAEGLSSVYMPGEQFTYDPRNNDPSLSSYSGLFPLKVRAVEYDEYYMPMTPGNWEDFTFTIDTSSGSGSGSNAEIELYDAMYFSIPDGTGQFNFGSTYVGSPLSQTFTIQNSGMDDLTLDASSLTLPSGFSLVSGFSETVSPYSQTYFTVQLDATAGGSYQGEISFANNDTDESPYSFYVTGVVDNGGGSGGGHDLPGDDLYSAHSVMLTTGTPMTLNEQIGDGVYGYGDVDLFKVSLTAGQMLDVDIDAEYLDDGTYYSYLDSHLRLFNSSGMELANNGDSQSGNDSGYSYYDSYLSFTATVTGDYYVGVSSSGNEYYNPNMPGMGYGYSDGDYVLQLLLTGSSNQLPVVTANQSFSLAEDAANGSSVGTAVGSDGDSDTLQSWTITGGNSAGVFAINAVTGQLTVANATGLNYEATTFYDLTLTVSDGNATSAPTIVTVNVTDVDEFDVGLITDADAGSDSVAEASAIGATVGVTVSAADADGSALVTYNLDDNAGGRFAINAATGVITAAAVLDYEAATSHVVAVRATSTDSSFSTANFTIAVFDVNESIGVAADVNSSPNLVAEDAVIGTTVGITVFAADPDAGNSATYSLDDNAGGRFAIDTATGVVTTSATLDAEVAASHSIIARATSTDGTFSTTTLSVSVTDVNEFSVNYVTDTNAVPNEVSMGRPVGTLVGVTAFASDEDSSDTVTYSLDDDAGGRFAIHAITGVVTTASIVEASPASHSIVVRAVSSDASFRLSTFAIAVTAVNDPPVIVPGQSFSVLENASEGTTLGAVLATDDGDTLQDWEIVDGNADGVFAIGSSSGVLSIDDATNLNFEYGGNYSLTVSVSDGVDRSHEIVSVVLVAENPPITVTSVSDQSNPNDGVITLREAVELANSRPGADTILISLPLTFPIAQQVIRLTQPASLQITSEIRIFGPRDGSKVSLSLSTNNTPQIRLFDVSTTGRLQLTDLMLDGGRPSGGGGAIHNSGRLVLDHATIAHSLSPADGGAIFNALNATAVLNNVTLSGNVASGSGGGVFNAGSLSTTNVTITANTATSGSGIANVGIAKTLNTLVAGNTFDDVHGSFESLGHNLVGTAAGSVGFITLADLVGTPSSPIDPYLGPLQDNGGVAWTHQLLVGSPAIDAGSNSTLASTDQRGAPRKLDGPDPNDATDAVATVDIGAFEFGTLFVNVELDAVDLTALGDGRVDIDSSSAGNQISLRAAIQEFNGLARWDDSQQRVVEVLDAHILFSPNARSLELTINGAGEDRAASGDLDVVGHLTIHGRFNQLQNTLPVLHATGTTSGFTDRMFHLLRESRLSIEYVNVTGGFVLNDGSTDSLRGAVILNDGGELTVLGSRLSFSDDSDFFGEAEQGGAIYTREGNLTVLESELIRNYARDGGGIYVESGNVSINDSVIAWGGATARGGGMFVESGDVVIDHTQIVHNYSDNRAAGLYNLNGTVRVTGESQISYNGFATPLGVFGGSTIGGAFFNVGQLTIDGGTRIEGNESIRGGGIYNQGQLEIRDSSLAGNFAEQYGGAVANVSTGTVIIERSRLVNNEAEEGNAIFNDNGKVTIVESSIEQYFNGFSGYHVFNYDLDAELIIIDTEFTGEGSGDYNIANSVWNLHGTVNILGCSFYESFNTETYTASEGAVVTNLGEYRFLGGTPEHFISLAASLNESQELVYVVDASVVDDIQLPFDIRIGDEEMTVTEVDEFLDTFVVDRQNAESHSVSDTVRIVISETQQYINLVEPDVMSRYALPLDVVVDYEVMTIVAMEGNVAVVERGRRGSTAAKHLEPVRVWGLAGALTITDSTFVESHVSELDGTGAVINHINPYVRPSTIENSTFSGHQIVDGSVFTDITNDFYWPARGLVSNPQWLYVPPMTGEPDIFPGLGTPGEGWQPERDAEYGLPVVLPTESLYIRNSVFDSFGDPSLHPFGLGLSERYTFEPEYPIDDAQTVIPALAREYPKVPFPIVVSHLDELGNALHEGMMVKLVGRDQFGNPAFEVERSTAPVWHVGKISISYPRERDLPTGRIVSGGNNFVNADHVSYTTGLGFENLDATQTAFDIAIPMGGLPVHLPFVIRVQGRSDSTVFAESMLVTAVDLVADQTAHLTVERGVGGTTAIAHESPLMMISRTGFWHESDRFGSHDSIESPLWSELVDTNGINASRQIVHVADPTFLPPAPFAITVTSTGTPPTYEQMLVTAVRGNSLTVERGSENTSPMEHPDGSRVTWHIATSFELHPQLGPFTDNGAPVATLSPLPDSPLSDSPSHTGHEQVALMTSLSSDYEVSSTLLMAVDPIALESSLTDFVDSQSTQLPVTTFPPQLSLPFLVRIDNELMEAVAVDSNAQLITVTRAHGGTTATEHGRGAIIRYGDVIDADSTFINVLEVSDFPTAPFLVRTEQETMLVTSVDFESDTLAVVRGRYGTTADEYGSGTLMTHGTQVEVSDTSAFTSFPFLAEMGSEHIYILSADYSHQLIEIERGANRTSPSSHEVNTDLRYSLDGYGLGFYGTGDYLGESRSERRLDSDGDADVQVDIGADEAALFFVNTTNDSPDLIPGDGIAMTSDGLVSLRAALMEASHRVGVTTVVVPAGTFVLDGQIEISTNVHLQGVNAQDTIIASYSDRIFTIRESGLLDISHATLTGGMRSDFGGAILVDQGSLAVRWSVLSNNTAAAGGAIYNNGGHVEISNSALTGNAAASGGAIETNGGAIRVVGTTISGNSATDKAGGVSILENASAEIYNSTIAFNSSPSAGGIRNLGQAVIANTIVASNTNGQQSDDVAGVFDSLGSNLIGVRAPALHLIADLSPTSTELVVADASDLPPLPFTLLVGNLTGDSGSSGGPSSFDPSAVEFVRVTAIDGNTLTVERGLSGPPRYHYYYDTELRFDGFFQPSDLGGKLDSPADPQLQPLQLSAGFVPVHPIALQSIARDSGNQSLFKGVDLLLSRSVAKEYDVLQVNRWGVLPRAPFPVEIESDVLLVESYDYHRLQLSAPQTDTHARGASVELLTDSRGAPRRFEPNHSDRLDIGAFELVSTYSIDQTPQSAAEQTGLDPTVFTFTVYRSGRTHEQSSVDYVVSGVGTHRVDAYDFVDRIIPYETITFAPGETQRQIQIHVAADDTLEYDETMKLTLLNPSIGGWIIAPVAMATIENDDSIAISVSNSPSTTEGGELGFEVAITSGSLQSEIVIQWTTSDGTAVQTLDYTHNSGSVRLGGKSGGHQIAYVRTTNDDVVELDETVGLLLTQFSMTDNALASLVSLSSSPTIGTILNDDKTSLVVDGRRFLESDSGQLSVAFDLRLVPHPIDVPVSVTLSTTDDTATSPEDFSETSLTFVHSGQISQVQTFVVPISGDLIIEDDERFLLSLTNLQAGGRELSITLVGAEATIVDGNSPTVLVSDATVVESNSGDVTILFDVVLLNPLGPLTVDVDAIPGGANQADVNDFIAAVQTLSFAGQHGETRTYSVTVHGDNVVELDETFHVILSNLVAGGDAASYRLINGVGTIRNDDEARLTVTTAASTHLENAGPIPFFITLDNPVDAPFTVLMSAAIPTALGDRYFAPNRVLEFAGDASETIQYLVVPHDDGKLNTADAYVEIRVADINAGGRQVLAGDTANVIVMDDEEVVESKQFLAREEELVVPEACGEEVGPDDTVETVSAPEYWAAVWTINVQSRSHPSGQVDITGGPLETAEQIASLVSFQDGVLFVGNDMYAMPVEYNGYFFYGALEEFYYGGWLYMAEVRGNPVNESFFRWTNRQTYSEELIEHLKHPICPLKLPLTGTPPPKESPIEPIAVDWTVPHTGSLTFNPFPTFNYRLAQDVGVSIMNDLGGFVRIGESVNLEFGAVTVNADMTLTYDPFDDLMAGGKLRPELDANGNVFRFTGIENFEAHIVDYGQVAPVTVPLGEGSGPAFLPITYASVPIELAVSNHLPTLRGDRIHRPDPSADAFYLDSPVFLDLDTTLRVDLTQLFVDLDGDTDLRKLRIKEINYGGQKLDMSDDSVTPHVVDRYPNQIRVPIATTTSGATVTDPATGNTIVQFGGDPNEPSLIAMPAGAAVDFHNTIWPGQIASLNNVNYPSLMFFKVTVTDSTKLPVLDANGQPTYDSSGDMIMEEPTWDVMIEVRPNPDTYTSSAAWRRQTSAPEIDYRPWVVEVTPKLDPAADDSAPRDSVGKSVKTSQQSVYGYNSEDIGGVDVDLNAGQFRRYHSLILDDSGGSSELAVGGLIYESATVRPEPIVRVQTNDNGTIEIAPARTVYTVTDTGVYGWEYFANISGTTLKTAGETPVVASSSSPIFGVGWSLQGVPSLTVNIRDDGDQSAVRATYDDRIVLAFPGQQPKVFNAQALVMNNYSYDGELNSLQPGSTEVGNDGFANPQEFGKLTSRQNPDELVYDDGTGMEYVFKKHDIGGDTTYLIDRIEQPGIDANRTTGAWPAGRRGISFTWDDSTHAHPILTTIEATDTSQTTLGYDSAGYLNLITTAGGTQTAFTVNADHELTEIRHITASDDPVRIFAYDDGKLIEDQWYTDDPTDPTKLVRHTEFAYTDGMLSEIQLGDSAAAGQNTVKYTIEPAGATLEATVTVDVPDLAKYDEATEAVTTTGGVYETFYKYSLDGLLERRAETFNGLELSRESWAYDQIGFVKYHTDPLGRNTTYWHDYETPRQDPSVHRGNVTYRFGQDAFTKYEYVIDATAGAKIGHLTKMTENASMNASGNPLSGGPISRVVSDYVVNPDGRLASRTVIRENADNLVESWTYNSDGYLGSYTDARGLVTNYVTYVDAQVTKTSVTDTFDGQTTETHIVYDGLGFIDTLETKYITTTPTAATTTISVTDYNYDARGLLAQLEVRDNGGNVLSRTKYAYAADGLAIDVITPDANDPAKEVHSLSVYDHAGLLTESISGLWQPATSTTAAVPATHYSLYTGSDVSLEQSTLYEYYADGSLAMTVHSDGTTQVRFVDPLTSTVWTKTNGVSAGIHDGARGQNNSIQASRGEFDEFGRQTAAASTVDKKTSSPTATEFSPPSATLPKVTVKVGPAGAQQTATRKFNSRGQLLVNEAAESKDEIKYDELGYVTTVTDMVTRHVQSEFTTNAAGDVTELKTGRWMPQASGSLTQFFYTEYVYDQLGRLRKTADTLTDGSGSGLWADEVGAVAATIDYVTETDVVIGVGLLKVTNTARSGVKTHQWLDALGRVVRAESADGSITKHTYDIAGNLIETAVLPVEGDDLTTKNTSDALGRLRVTTVESSAAGFKPFFRATDYFASGDAGADEWNSVNFIPLEIAGGTLNVTDPTTYVLPDGATDVKYLSTRTRVDAVGKPFYIQGPDPSPAAGDTPTTVITYERVAALDATSVTTRQSVFDNSLSAGALTGIDTAYPHQRVTREITNSLGQTVMTLAKMSDFNTTDAVMATASLDQFADTGFIITSRIEYFLLNGQVKTATDGEGNDTHYQYDHRGNVTKVTDAKGHATVFEYDSAGNRLKETDANNHSTRYTYDALNRVTLVRDALTNDTRYEYQNGGDYVEVTNARGFTTTTWVDPVARTQEVFAPEGISLTTEFDSAGNTLKTTDALNNVAEFKYDALGRQTQSAPAPGTVYDFVYDVRGNVVSEDPPVNPATTHEYDVLGRRTKTIDAAGNEYKYTYDVSGNVLSEEDPLTHITDYVYDGLNRRTKVTVYPDASNTANKLTTVTDYDNVGNVVKVTDPLQHYTTYTYTDLNQLEKVTDYLSGETTYSYDDVGNRRALKDSENNVTEWYYDALNRVDLESSPLIKVRRYEYDEVGNLTKYTDRNNRVIEYVYDGADRRTNEKWLDAGGSVTRTITIAYDAASRITSVSDPDATITYSNFDGAGRAQTVDNNIALLGQTATLTQAFDDVGNRETLTVAVGGSAAFTNTYVYDMLNRVDYITQGGGIVSDKRADFGYDAAGRLSSINRYADATGVEFVAGGVYSHDDANRLTGLVYDDGAGTVLANYGWSFDAGGRITQFTSTDGTATYGYDETNQLTSESYAPVSGLPSTTSYAYDDNGNRDSITIDGVTTDYADPINNQTISDGAFDYGYDDEGNRTSRTPVGTGETTEYEWDHRNRLRKIVDKDATGTVLKEVEYTYDPLNRRIAKSVDTPASGLPPTASYFINDGDRAAREGAGDHVVVQLDGSGNVTNAYLQGAAIDQILADEQFTPSSSPPTSSTLWPLADNLGSIRDLVTHDEYAGTTTVANHIIYDAFGNITDESDDTVDHMFGFTGRERDEESDLQYNRARYFDAAIGQWASEDPLGFDAGDANLRRYVGNKSTFAVDPSGLDEFYLMGDSREELLADWDGGSPPLNSGYPWIDATGAFFNEVSHGIHTFGVIALTAFDSDVGRQRGQLLLKKATNKGIDDPSVTQLTYEFARDYVVPVDPMADSIAGFDRIDERFIEGDELIQRRVLVVPQFFGTVSVGTAVVGKAVPGMATRMYPNLRAGSYHATNPNAVSNIRQFGFDVHRPTAAAAFHNNPFGPGIYLMESPTTAAATGRGSSILQFRVTGKNLNVCKLGRITLDDSHAIARGASRHGFDSITYMSPEGPATVVFNPSNAIPLDVVPLAVPPSVTPPIIGTAVPNVFPQDGEDGR
jgi:RHS repeat-associated protein